MVDWNVLVREHGAAVFGIAWRILGHAQDAEDVVQEVFAQASRQSNGKQVVCWPALLRRMATCRAMDALRRRRITIPLDRAELDQRPGRSAGDRGGSRIGGPIAGGAGRTCAARGGSLLPAILRGTFLSGNRRDLEHFAHGGVDGPLSGAVAIGKTVDRTGRTRCAMNEADIHAPPADEELQGVLRRAADAVRSCPPPAESERRVIERASRLAAAQPRSRRSLPPEVGAMAAAARLENLVGGGGSRGLDHLFRLHSRRREIGKSAGPSVSGFRPRPAYHFVLKDIRVERPRGSAPHDRNVGCPRRGASRRGSRRERSSHRS